MDRRRYVEAAAQHFTEFGGFHPTPAAEAGSLVSEWAEAVLEREEEGLTTLVAFLPIQTGSLLTGVRDELIAHLAARVQGARQEALGLLLLVAEEPITRESFERVQALMRRERRVQIVPWVVDLGRGRLIRHQGPPFGIDPDLAMLASLGQEPAAAPSAQPGRHRDRIPWMTLGLAGVNVLIWLAMTAMGRSINATEQIDLMIQWGAANRPNMLVTGEYWRLLTSGFLHFGAVHLITNTLSLWWVGQLVEVLYGRLRMLLIYLIALVVGSIASLLFGPSIVAAAGASGAIFGLLGAILWYTLVGAERRRLNGRYIFMIVGVYLGYGLIGGGTIDNWGHLGGLVGGVLAAMAVGTIGSWRTLAQRLMHGLATTGLVGVMLVALLGYLPFPGPSARLANALIALQAERYDQAEPGLLEASRAHPDEPQLHVMLAYIYVSEGRLPEARSRLERALALDPANEDAQVLLQHLRPPTP